MTRAGLIALMLLGSGLAPAPAAAVVATTHPAAVVAPLAPDARPLPAGQAPGAPATGSPTAPATADDEDAGDDSETDRGEDAQDPDADPLTVEITRLSPSTLPRRGPVTISGRITNDSDTEWTDLRVYAATSATPITTEQELALAEASPARVEPADYQRIVDPDLFVPVPDLGPGRSVGYRLSLPRRSLQLPATPGLYRVGVQVLGTDEEGRVEGADGRARVLMASLPRVGPGERATLALAIQVRRRTVRTATGEVDYPSAWRRSLGHDGRLRQIVGLLGSSGSYPVTAVIDPAVVEAAGSLAEGNGGFDLSETTVDGVDEVNGTITDAAGTPAPDAESSEGASDQGTEDESDAGDPDGERRTNTAVDAISWLQELRAAAPQVDMTAIPYGDLDLGSAARHGPADLVGRSVAAGISMLSDYGIQATGLVAPHHGLLGPRAAQAVPRGVPLMLAERSFVDAVVEGESEVVLDTQAESVPTTLTGATGATIWTYTPIRAAEGAAVGDSALEMRQRILARGAIRVLDRSQEPLLVVLPPQWRPGPAWEASDFFRGLRAPWLRPTRLDSLQPDATPVVSGLPDGATISAQPSSGPSAGPAAQPDDEPTPALALHYPARQLAREVPRPVFVAARQLSDTGRVLGGLVVDGDVLAPRVQRQAMLGLSFHTRGRVARMIGRLRASDNVLRAQVHDVEVLAPRFVRMSSATGSFLVPVVNRLDVPVRVQLQPRISSPGLTLEVPEPVVVEPRTRQPIRVVAEARTIGIRSVRVDLVTAAGDQLYVGPTISIRNSQVARWVWVAMAVGSALLFLTIIVRIVRRVRARRSTHGPVLMRRGAARRSET